MKTPGVLISLLEDREACVKEIEQSPDAMASRQNPTVHPDYVSHFFTDMNRCIERNGRKLLSVQPQLAREPAKSEFAQGRHSVPDSDPKAIGVIRGFDARSSDIPSVAHR